MFFDRGRSVSAERIGAVDRTPMEIAGEREIMSDDEFVAVMTP